MLHLPDQFVLAIDAVEARHAEWFEAHRDFASGVSGKPLSHFTILHYANDRFDLLLSQKVEIPDQIRLECAKSVCRKWVHFDILFFSTLL